VIAEIAEIAADAAPDLILHTGDLFDGPRPAMTEFGRAIRALRTLAEVAPVVVLAGNHDSSAALEVLGIAVSDGHAADVAAGRFNPHARCGHRIRVHHKATVPDAGAVTTYATAAGIDLRLAALPFVHQNRVLTDYAAICDANASYNDSIRKIIDVITDVCLDGFDPTRNVAVLASHLHVNGARTSSERELHVSTAYATDPAHLHEAYGYLAFGHIHVPQPFASGRGRYAGSILQVDFGESGETKQVNLVDLEPGRRTAVTGLPLTAGRRLHRLRTPLSTLADHAADVAGGLVEVTVAPEPGAETIDRASAVEIGGRSYDTLSEAVRTVLAHTTVVGVIDGRNTDVHLADDVDAPTEVETVDDAFASWLAGGGTTVLRDRPGATASRVLELFSELRAHVGDGATDTAALTEVDTLTALLATEATS